MKIAYILPSLANKGPIIVAKDLVNVMSKHGHECFVFYFDDKNELHFQCPTQRIKMNTFIDFNSYDIIHSHGIRPDTYVWLHKPQKCISLCVSTLHNFVFKDLSAQYNKFISSVFGYLWMKILNKHDRIIVLSNVALMYYCQWININKLYVAYNTRIIECDKALCDEEKQEISLFKENSLILGVNALLTPRKGVDLIIKAMPFLKDVKLWIVGEGKSKEQLKKMVKELGIEKRVYFAGYRKDAYRYLPYYDIYIMSSRSEGFPLSLLEACIFKKNIICSNIPIFKEIFSEKEVTFFEIDNVQSLVDAVKYTILYDKSEHAYLKFEKKYSPETFYCNHLNIYTQ